MALTGHAIECRINAEDPQQDFRPCPGKVDFLHFPGGPGVRVDSALYNGCTLSPYYDSLAAKLLVHAPTRLEAIRRMRRCLEEFALEGFATNAELSYQISVPSRPSSGAAAPPPFWMRICRRCWSSAAGCRKVRRRRERIHLCPPPGPAAGHEGHAGQLCARR